jgi:hypothetical protein
MSFVLIAFIAGINGGGPVNVGEFTNIGACKDAGRSLTSTLNATRVTKVITWTCLPVTRN